MKHRNLTDFLARIMLAGALALLLQACGSDVGGNEDDSQPVARLTSLNDGEEVIGTWPITWDTSETNRSTVDLYISIDSGATWALMKSTLPDTGNYSWDSNEVDDCRRCRMRVVPKDVVGNVGEPAESAQDFVVNNVPQVLGIAFYRDVGNNGPGDEDEIRVPFDKDLELRTSIASDIFEFPVLGDSAGSFAEISRSPTNPRELLITMNDLSIIDLHLHVRGLFNPNILGRTAPSGINLRKNISEGVIFAPDTGRTAASAALGIDIVPTFTDSGQVFGSARVGALGDIDGDRDLDLVAGDGSQPIQVWINGGDGLFVSGQAVGGTNRRTTSLALGDVDNDGDLDMVEGNSEGGSVNRVWINDGLNPASFSAGPSLGNRNTVAIALGDVDLDGDLDIMVGNKNATNSSIPRIFPHRVWINNGNNPAVFSAGQPMLGDSNTTTSIALGDVDGDGYLDMVEGNDRDFGSGGQRTPQPNRVWLNGGVGNPGAFTVDSTQALGNNATFSVSLGDIDDDGDLDLVTGNVANAPNRVWLNDEPGNPGKGVFSDSGQALGNSNTVGVALNDIDDDGDLDLVAGNGFGGIKDTSRVWINGGDSTGSISGVFSDSGQSLGNNDTPFVVMGDIDGDGDVDLVAESLFLNSLASTSLFIEADQLQGIDKTYAVALGDLDGDGDLDLVQGNQETGATLSPSPNRVWFNGGDSTGSNTGVFKDTGQALGDSQTASVALGDLDGDGDLDLVTGNGGGQFTASDPNRVWLNGGDDTGSNTGIFSEPQPPQALGNSPTSSIALADVDGDGDLDIVSGNGGEVDVPNRVWRNDGAANFSEDGIPQELGRNATTSIALGDIDGDGDLDLVEGNGEERGGGPQSNRIWLNGGTGINTNTGVFMEKIQSWGSNRTVSIALGDIDGDGHLDMVEGNDGANRVWRNDGTGQFIEDTPPQLLGTNATASVSLADFDGDGDLDLIEGIGNRRFGDRPGPNRVWLNGGDSTGSNTGVFVDSGLELGVTLSSTPLGKTTSSIVVGDVDGDGDLDHIEASTDSGNFKSTVWLNDFCPVRPRTLPGGLIIPGC